MSNEKMSEQHEIELERKAQFFYRNKALVHIILRKKNPMTGKSEWERGWILKEPDSDAFYLKFTEEGHRKRGQEQGAFFYFEVLDIQEANVPREVTI